MNCLMVGVPNAKGSWEMRGQQLGAALGARVTSAPTAADWAWADLVVLVKRAGPTFAGAARAAGVPIVWDALDFWRQPLENSANESRGRALLKGHLDAIKPVLTIGATQAMADAAGGVYLPHHSWEGLTPTPAREVVSVVAYEGNAVYLGKWAGLLQKACQARGWRFVVNPPSLSEADILVALRDGPWDGWMCREWKSGVKLINALAAGRPMITQQSAAVRELASIGSVAESVTELHASLDYWASWEWRTRVVELCGAMAPAYSLTAVAERYRQILQTVEARCAA